MAKPTGGVIDHQHPALDRKPAMMDAPSRPALRADADTKGFQASFVRVLPDTVAARGVDAAPVWQALGLRLADTATATTTEAPRVPAARLGQALDVACQLLNDPQLPLQAALAVRPQHLGSLGYALMSSPLGEDGLTVYERFQSLLCDDMHAHHRVFKGLIEVRHEPLGQALPRNARFWWFLLGARLSFARWVSGRELVPVRIDLPCPRPAHAEAFERLMGCPVRYDTPDCRELMPADWLAWLNPNGDPALHALMQARSARQLAQRPQGHALLTRARLVLAAQLDTGQTVQLDTVAQALSEEKLPCATTARQLQKRLAEQGLSFKDLLEEVRRERALRLLRDTEEPIARIAQACGYTELSPFHRAVRRWTGLTPRQVRQQA